MPTLAEMAGPEKKIAIAFPDRVKGGSHARAHRKVAIPLVVEDLLKGRAKIETIVLICAIGLHRMNTVGEWRDYLGRDIVNQFYPERLVNHGAEQVALLDLGTDEMGNAVQCNHLVAQADIAVVIGHCAGNPHGGCSGGDKMMATGITGWKSIASQHLPKTMHRDDWLGASPEGRMRDQFQSIGKAMAVGYWALPCGATGGALETCKPVFDCFARAVFDVGGPGSGHTVKLLKQMMFGAINAMTAERMATKKAQ